MRVGIHSFAFNVSDQSPIASLPRTLRDMGHEVVFLDTDKAQLKDGVITFPELPADAKLDVFIPYLPSCDMDVLWHGAKPGDVPYFEQLRLLSKKFPSPWPYDIQAIVNDKLQMRDVFLGADLPIPQTYDLSDPASRTEILSEIQNGKKFVCKPCFGGNSFGVVKVGTIGEAEAAFHDIDRQGVAFVAQSFIQGPQAEGRAIDYRAFVIGDHVTGLRCISNNWKRDYDAGTEDEPYQLTPEQERDAAKAVHAAGMAMGSVDILIDAKTGQHYISEIGDNIALDEYECLGNLSKLVVYMLEKKYGSNSKMTFCADNFNIAHNEQSCGIQDEDLPRPSDSSGAAKPNIKRNL